MIVQNIAGAGGMTGSSRVAKAAPDGYQIMLGTSATHALSQALHKSPPFNASTDFAPVALIAEQPFVLIARKDLPVDSLQQFTAYAKANEATMRYGSAGAGSATHLVCALLNSKIGVKVNHAPYNGGVAAMNDLIAGRLDYFCPVVTIAIPQIEHGGVKAVAILAKNRVPTLPNLPTAHEQGLAEFAINTWFAIFLPKGAPVPIIQKLHSAIMATVETPSVLARLNQISAEVVSSERRTPGYLKKFLQTEIEKWATAINAANLKID